jgi:hypothetical protein
MIFILDQTVEFTSEIQPACLPLNKSPIDYPILNSTILVAGWGLANGSDSNSLSVDLKNALIQTVDTNLCESQFEFNISGSIFCAGKSLYTYKGKRGYSASKFLLLFISIVFYVEIKIQVTEMPTIFRWFKLPRRKIRSTGYF